MMTSTCRLGEGEKEGEGGMDETMTFYDTSKCELHCTS